MHASTVAFALFAASQVLAAPTPASNTNTNDARSISAIGDAISGFAEDVLGPHIGKRDVDARSLSAIENFIHNLKRDGPDARSIDAIANALGNFAEKVVGPHIGKREVDERSLTAISNFIHNLKRSEEIDERSLSAIEGVFHNIFGKRSLKAVGAAVAGGVASGVAGAVAGDLLGRSEPSGLMVDTETGTLYMDIPDANEGRSLKAVGVAVAGGVASGVAGAVASNVFGRSEPSGVMVDTETGTIYMDVPDSTEPRSLKAVGAAVAGGIASGVAGAAASSILGRSEPSGLMVDTDTGVIYMDIPDENGARSLKAVGAAVAGGVASGVAGAVAGDLLGRSETSGLMVDTETGVIYMDVPDANEGRSLKAVGAAVAGGVASGVAGAVAGDLLGRSVGDDELLDSDKRSLTAIGNFISGIFNKRDEPLNARSLTAIGNFISGIFNKRDGGSAVAINHQIKQILQRSELAASMAARSIDDLE